MGCFDKLKSKVKPQKWNFSSGILSLDLTWSNPPPLPELQKWTSQGNGTYRCGNILNLRKGRLILSCIEKSFPLVRNGPMFFSILLWYLKINPFPFSVFRYVGVDHISRHHSYSNVFHIWHGERGGRWPSHVVQGTFSGLGGFISLCVGCVHLLDDFQYSLWRRRYWLLFDFCIAKPLRKEFVNWSFSCRIFQCDCAKDLSIYRLFATYDQLEDMGAFSQIGIHFLPDTCCCYIPFYLCTDVIGRYDTG